MIFASGQTSLELPNPEYGYTAQVVMPIKYFEHDCGWETWDNGSAYDYRVSKIPGSLFSDSQMKSLSDFMLNQNKGRTSFTLNLGSNSGFFPFGPDLGDSGEFQVRIINRKNSGALLDPWLMFSSEFTMVMESKPDYLLPTVEPQGNFSIGPVTTLMFPQDGFTPNTKYGATYDLTNSGNVTVVDTNAHTFETDFDVYANQSNAAHLVNFLQSSSGRGNYMFINADSNYYPFGIENPDRGSFNCILLKNTLEIKHIEHDQFRIPLKFWVQSCQQ